jgi:hypothetical protein
MARCWQKPGNATEKEKEQNRHEHPIKRVDMMQAVIQCLCMNVFIYALGALIDRMSPKVDGWGGGDASKNQLQ